ncbi:uncharacterized protein NPIL_403331, partial [Nephila pilipes]
MYAAISSSQMMLIVAACTFVPLFIYLIYKFSIKEKSFEEVLEEQKRRSLEEEMRQKSEKVKKEKKFKKSWAKRKEKAETETVSESPPVEKKEIPQIEIIEPVEVKSPKQKNKKSANQNIENHIEKSKKAEVAVGAEKQEKKRDSEKEEVDKVKSVAKPVKIEKETDKAKNVVKPTETVKPKSEVNVEKSPSVPSTQTVSVPASTSNKKKKKEQVVEKDVPPLTVSKLLSLIKDADLETEGIQNLIDILLNKQKDASSWTKPNDQLADTKRNLQEKEQQLDLELRQNQAVVSKLKDLRDDYNTLKTKYAALEKSSQEKINKQQQDIQSFTSRLKQVQEQGAAEKEKSTQVSFS